MTTTTSQFEIPARFRKLCGRFNVRVSQWPGEYSTVEMRREIGGKIYATCCRYNAFYDDPIPHKVFIRSLYDALSELLFKTQHEKPLPMYPPQWAMPIIYRRKSRNFWPNEIEEMYGRRFNRVAFREMRMDEIYDGLVNDWEYPLNFDDVWYLYADKEPEARAAMREYVSREIGWRR